MNNLPVEGRWSASPARFVRQHYASVMVPTACAIVFTLGASLLLFQNMLLLLAINCLAWSLILVAACSLSERGPVRAKRNEHLRLEDPTDTSLALVSVCYHQGSNLVGIDRGVLFLESGLIRFTGVASHFALAASDFDVSLNAPGSLRIRNQWQSLRIVIQPLRHTDDPKAVHGRKVIAQIATLGPCPPDSLPERTYPPFTHWREAELRLTS